MDYCTLWPLLWSYTAWKISQALKSTRKSVNSWEFIVSVKFFLSLQMNKLLLKDTWKDVKVVQSHRRTEWEQF